MMVNTSVTAKSPFPLHYSFRILLHVTTTLKSDPVVLLKITPITLFCAVVSELTEMSDVM